MIKKQENQVQMIGSFKKQALQKTKKPSQITGWFQNEALVAEICFNTKSVNLRSMYDSGH